MVKNQFEEKEMNESKPRARYTLQYKLEAVRLVKGGQVAAVTAKILGIPKQTAGELGALGQQGPAQGRRRQAGEPGANGAGQAAR